MSTRVWLPLVTADGVSILAWSSPATTADLDRPAGTLTIRAELDGSIVQAFRPCEWLRATVFDADGQPLRAFRNSRFGMAAGEFLWNSPSR